MRDADSRLCDLLFADSPGEWFQRWAVDPQAPDAEGARWLAARASAIVVVADCEALAGDRRGPARNDVLQLLRRVSVARNARPVALVWTKADVTVPAPIRTAVSETALRTMPDVAQFEMSIAPFESGGVLQQPNEALLKILKWMIAPLDRGFKLPTLAPSSPDPFFAIGAGA